MLPFPVFIFIIGIVQNARDEQRPKDWELELFERSVVTYKYNKNVRTNLGLLT